MLACHRSEGENAPVPGRVRRNHEGVNILSFNEARDSEAVKNYWQAIATIFSEAWAAPRKHLVTKGVGIAALAELGKWVIQDCLGKDDVSVAAISEYVKKLEGFDWANQTSPIKLIGGQKGAKGAAEAFKSVVFGTKEIGDLANMLVEG